MVVAAACVVCRGPIPERPGRGGSPALREMAYDRGLVREDDGAGMVPREATQASVVTAVITTRAAPALLPLIAGVSPSLTSPQRRCRPLPPALLGARVGFNEGLLPQMDAEGR